MVKTIAVAALAAVIALLLAACGDSQEQRMDRCVSWVVANHPDVPPVQICARMLADDPDAFTG